MENEEENENSIIIEVKEATITIRTAREK